MSTNTNEQNGRQPPLPKQQSPPKDPRIRPGNVSEPHKSIICRKFVWGTCNKGVHCKFRHELVFDEMKQILKFCHDYQNKQGCTRIDCTYLHITTEEEALFNTKHQLPRVLQERYTAMQSDMSNIEGMQMMFVPPPPPPPPPPAPAPAPMIPAGGAAPMMATSGAAMMSTAPPPPQMLPVFATLQQPPPPPPPPTMPLTPTVHTPPAFTVPPPPPKNTHGVFGNMHQPVLPLFDASRPPPNINVRNNTAKRKVVFLEAGPSKIRKPEEPKADNHACDSCIQREIRLDMYKQQLEKLQYEEECQRLVYKMKLEEYEKGKELIRSLVSPEMYRKLDEYIEGGPPQMHDTLGSLSQASFNVGSTMSEQLLLQLMQLILNNARNPVDATPSHRPEDNFIQSLSRRTSKVRQSSSLEIVQTTKKILELLSSNSGQFERSQIIDGEVPRAGSSSSNTNTLGRYTNGQKLDSSTVAAATSVGGRLPAAPTVGAAVRDYSAAPAPLAAPPASYPLYQPAVPPPAPPTAVPPYYPHQYASTSTTTNTSSNQYSMPRGVPTSRHAPPSQPPNYQYMMGRYQQPPRYFPPFQ